MALNDYEYVGNGEWRKKETTASQTKKPFPRPDDYKTTTPTTSTSQRKIKFPRPSDSYGKTTDDYDVTNKNSANGLSNAFYSTYGGAILPMQDPEDVVISQDAKDRAAARREQAAEPEDEGPSVQDMIEELLEAQREQRIAELDAARERALSVLESTYGQKKTSLETAKNSYVTNLENALASSIGNLDTEQAKVSPYYYDKRNQAAAQSDVGALNFAQFMAGRGIKGGAGAMPEIYRNAALQGNIGALNQAEAANLAEIERNRSQIQNAYENNQANVLNNYATDLSGLDTDYLNSKQSMADAYEQDIAAANAGISAQGLQAYIDQLNADRMFGLNEAQITGRYGGTPTLAAQQYSFENALNEAGLTGVYRGANTGSEGVPTLASKQFDLAAQNQAFNQAIQEAGLTGRYKDQPTFAFQQWKADEEFRNKSFDEQVRQFEKNYQIDLRQMTLQETQQQLDEKYRRGQLSLQQAQNAMAQAKFAYQKKQDEYQKQQNEEQTAYERQQAEQQAQQESAQAYNGYMQKALEMMTAGNYNSYTGTTDKQYNTQQVLAYINSLPISAAQKASMANDLQLYR
mgnify:CR=1 FL=1